MAGHSKWSKVKHIKSPLDAKRGQPIIEDRLHEFLPDSGTGELTTEEDHYLLITAHHRFYSVAEALKNEGLATEFQKHTHIPETTIPVADESTATQVDTALRNARGQ